MMEIVTGVLLMLTGVFLICHILLQQGGPGLVSTYNGTSGISVFGIRNDRGYSRITAAVAVAWGVLAGFSIHALS